MAVHLSKDNDNLTLFHRAILESNVATVEHYLKSNKNPEKLVNAPTAQGMMPLHLAADCIATLPSLQILTALLDNKADLMAENQYKETALFTAARRGNAPAVKILIEKGANVHSKNNMNKTPLECVIDFTVEMNTLTVSIEPYIRIIAILLTYGAIIAKEYRGNALEVFLKAPEIKDVLLFAGIIRLLG